MNPSSASDLASNESTINSPSAISPNLSLHLDQAVQQGEGVDEGEGSSFHSFDPSPSPPIWAAEERWNVEPDKLDDEEIEVLGALLPVIATETRKEQEGIEAEGGGNSKETTTSGEPFSLLSDIDDEATSPPAHPFVSTPSVRDLTQRLSSQIMIEDRSSFASLRNFVNQPIPPLSSGPPQSSSITPEPFSCNRTPSVRQSVPQIVPSQLLNERVELNPFSDTRRHTEPAIASSAESDEVQETRNRASEGGVESLDHGGKEKRNELDEEHDEMEISLGRPRTPPLTPPESPTSPRSSFRRFVTSPFFPVQSIPSSRHFTRSSHETSERQ
ncbi:uncharacterized protein JCM6883_005552 [Sporobolomyces salmoneus]|uniref:uncharacterized protein n=1 Tax=Sporobolomyces salmoneus TaxID=183962 RepID=UPI0031805485